MPERSASCRIQREQIARVIRGEEKMAGGRKNSLQAFAVAKFAVPNHFASPVIERAQSGIGPKNAVAAAPAFGFRFYRVVVNAEKAPSDDVKEIRLRVETGRHPVGGAIRTGLD